MAGAVSFVSWMEKSKARKRGPGQAYTVRATDIGQKPRLPRSLLLGLLLPFWNQSFSRTLVVIWSNGPSWLGGAQHFSLCKVAQGLDGTLETRGSLLAYLRQVPISLSLSFTQL